MTQNKIFSLLDALLYSRVVVVAAPQGSGVTMVVRRIAEIAAPAAQAGRSSLRAPHHTVSDSGAREELSLARGVLYLDDAHEFGRRTLANLSTAIRRRRDYGAHTPIWILRADTLEQAQRVHSVITGQPLDGTALCATWNADEGIGVPHLVDLTEGEGEMNQQVNSNSGFRFVERTYSDPSAAQERAMQWERSGLKSITIRPYTTSHGTRIFVLSAMATDGQVRAL